MTEVLLLAGRVYPLDYLSGGLSIAGHPLFIKETADSDLGTGCSVWDGAVTAAKYLEAVVTPAGLAGKNVLELGAGTGLVGIAAGVLGAGHVFVSDLPYALRNAADNVAANASALKCPVDTIVLDWTCPTEPKSFPSMEPVVLPPLDFIVGADVVWIDALVEPLVGALTSLASCDKPPTIIIAHQTRARSTEDLLFRLLENAGFSIEEVPHTRHHPEFHHPSQRILLVTRT